VVIAVLVVVAALRMNSDHPSVAPNPPTAPAQPTGSAPTTPDLPDSGGPFCTAYYMFSINVSASWASFENAVSEGDATTGLMLVTEFQTQTRAMQQAEPPADMGAQIDMVAQDFQTSRVALSTGSVTGVPDVNSTWADVEALQTSAGTVCG